MRVVFDTNALSNDNFELLESGPMRELCRRGRLVAVYGHVFVEETMRTYASERRRLELVTRRLPFLADTATLICNDFIDIWHSELVEGRGVNARIYMRRRQQERLVATWRNVPADGSWHAWHASEEARDEEDRKRAAQKDTSETIRREIATWKRNVGYDPNKHGVPDLQSYIDSNLDFAGREFIGALVRSKNPKAVANMWASATDSYPYFTTFVQNMLYIAHYAMTKPNAIDLNAQADMDVMTHLLHADVLVSNETRFMRAAFDDVWRPKGKVLFTSREFAAFIRKL